jgi:hypothetical protein
MNERIKEMSKQAHLVADATYAEGPDEIWLKEYNKKFAELIVRECANIAKQTDADDGDDYKSGRQWAGIEILKHFNVGVEE